MENCGNGHKSERQKLQQWLMERRNIVWLFKQKKAVCTFAKE